MKKYLLALLAFFQLVLLTGCSSVGSKTASLSVVYGVMVVLSFVMLMGYCLFIRKKKAWFILLFGSVFVVNIGYFALGISHTLGWALNANRMAYLGSVFLPLSMFMIILDVSGFSCKRWISVILIAFSVLVFFVAASPGYLDIYYKSVSLETVNGVTVLNKEYGPWHCLYLYYLLGYFIAIITAVTVAICTKKIDSPVHSVILVSAVAVNIGVWFIEQMVKLDFEFLSVSYIISELFLICLYLVIQSQESLLETLKAELVKSAPQKMNSKKAEVELHNDEYLSACLYMKEHVSTLTATERVIYQSYLDGKTTKEILAELNITENTLKYHNKNIYSKLGVSSRKQLKEYAKVLADSHLWK